MEVDLRRTPSPAPSVMELDESPTKPEQRTTMSNHQAKMRRMRPTQNVYNNSSPASSSPSRHSHSPGNHRSPVANVSAPPHFPNRPRPMKAPSLPRYPKPSS